MSRPSITLERRAGRNLIARYAETDDRCSVERCSTAAEADANEPRRFVVDGRALCLEHVPPSEGDAFLLVDASCSSCCRRVHEADGWICVECGEGNS